MERAFKWLTLALIALEVVLVRSGMLDITTAIGVVVAFEALILLVAGRQVIVAVRRYRRERTAGLDIWLALEDGLTSMLPRRLARVIALELRLWTCLARWLLRRVRLGEGEFSYYRRSILGPFLIVLLFTTPAEILLFELLIPWDWVRWLLLVAAIYTLVWVFAYYASLVALPHRLEADVIRLRHGAFGGGEIPYREITHIEQERRRSPGGRDGLRIARGEDAAYLAIGGRTDVTLQLSKGQTLIGWLGPTAPVTTVHLAADEPGRLVQELEQRVDEEIDEVESES